MAIRALLIVLLLIANSIAAAKPKIELNEAARLAQSYVASHKIENGDRYLAKVNWHEDFEHPEKSCWIVFWAHNEPTRLDGELVVWVYEDGRIRHQDTGA